MIRRGRGRGPPRWPPSVVEKAAVSRASTGTAIGQGAADGVLDMHLAEIVHEGRPDLPTAFFLHEDLESGLLKDGQMKRAQVHGRADYCCVLKEHEAGAKTADLARKHGVSEATIYNWKAKFGGMDVSEAKRLKQLEDENAKLKKLLAEQMLDAAALRELLVKKW